MWHFIGPDCRTFGQRRSSAYFGGSANARAAEPFRLVLTILGMACLRTAGAAQKVCSATHTACAESCVAVLIAARNGFHLKRHMTDLEFLLQRRGH